MATVEENYKEVFGTDPSPELKNRLNLIKNKLQIDAQIIGLKSYPCAICAKEKIKIEFRILFGNDKFLQFYIFVFLEPALCFSSKEK